MKSITSNLIRISALLLVIAIFVSCKPRIKYDNYFKIGENVYEITHGGFINKGETEGGFKLDLRLYGEAGSNFLSFNIVSSSILSFTGIMEFLITLPSATTTAKIWCSSTLDS